MGKTEIRCRIYLFELYKKNIIKIRLKWECFREALLFCYGDEENVHIHEVHLTTANESMVRRVYHVSVWRIDVGGNVPFLIVGL